MKTLSLHCVAALALVLVTSSATATFAQSSTTTTSSTPAKHHGGDRSDVLTDAEKAQLKADRDKVFAADPALKTEFDGGREKIKSASTPEEKKAAKAEYRATEAKIKAAVLKIDPSAAPLISKVEAAHPGHHKKS